MKDLTKIAPDSAKAVSPPRSKRKRLGPIPADYEEASSNFDLHGVAPFLERLTDLVDGFGSAEKEAVEEILDAMEVEEETDIEFPVTFQGEKVRLRFKLFMCDEGAVDLFVFTVQPLSDQIQDAMSDEDEWLSVPRPESMKFGKVFEAAVLKAVGLEKNATHSIPASGKAGHRIPDGLGADGVVLLEVKGVEYLNLTDQVKDLLAAAETNSQKVIVVVKGSTKLSEQYRERLAQGDLTIARIDASTPEPAGGLPAAATPADVAEASANFDLHGVAPFLESVGTLVDGFGSAERAMVKNLLNAMGIEEEAEVGFPVVFRDEKVHLHFKLFMCDEGAVDLAAFTVPALSQEIQVAMEGEQI